MKKFLLTLLAIAAFVTPCLGAPGASEEFMQDAIEVYSGNYVLAAFYDTDGSGACEDGTYDTYVNTNQTGTAAGYVIGNGTGTSYTTGISGAVVYIDDFSTETANVTTLSSATMVDADCIVLYASVADTTTLAANDPAIYYSVITSISPTAEDVTITFPTDDASNAIVRVTVP